MASAKENCDICNKDFAKLKRHVQLCHPDENVYEILFKSRADKNKEKPHVICPFVDEDNQVCNKYVMRDGNVAIIDYDTRSFNHCLYLPQLILLQI